MDSEFESSVRTVNLTVHVRLNNFEKCLEAKYQLLVVGGSVVGVSKGEQKQLAVGVNGEETQEVVFLAFQEVCHSLGLRLRRCMGPAKDV